MKPKKQPYMPFYPGDWKKDIGVQLLSLHDQMVWFKMLMEMHDSEERGVLILNGRPLTKEEIARLINLDNQIFEQAFENIKNNNVFSIREDGAIYCRSMVRRSKLSVKRTISGSQGGNPNLVNQKSEQADQPNADIDNDNETDLNKIEIALPEFQTPKLSRAIERWAQHRRKLGKSFDQMAADALLNLYAGRPQDLADDIDHSISNGWRTLNAKNNAIFKQPKKSQREILQEMMDADNATE